MDEPSWTPSAERVASANLSRFTAEVGQPDVAAMRAWSIAEPGAFWSAVWDFCGVIGEKGDRLAAHGDQMYETRFFPDGFLNVAENLLRGRGDSIALVFRGEPGVLGREITRAELRRMTGRIQQALIADGVGPGDRVAAWLPNVPETIATMLAAAAIGAVFTSTSPDFGVDGVVDRFGQTEPTVLVGCGAYSYGGTIHDRLGPLAEVRDRLPSVRRVVVVPFAGEPSVGDVADAVLLDDWLAPHDADEPTYAPLPFDHPWYILYSSGTTGKPKCIVHRAGGVFLKHLTEHVLHGDVHPGDRVFYFTTAGWMMWNWLVSGLAAEATLVLYDGSPFHPDGNAMFDLIDDTGITLFGTSAKFIEAVGTAGLHPIETHDLSTLRTICSTGSPLVAEGFDTIYRDITADVHVASISGGTDLCGCLVAGDPTAPVWRGEIQGAGFGLDTEVVDETGAPLPPGERGELVCRTPFPSMPLRFHDDPGDERYRAAYFERIPGVWHQGDFAERTEHGGFIIHGRSDATLNPGGVRIGTAEIYRQVGKVPEVVESIVIGQRQGGDTRVVLFVVLADGVTLDDGLRDQIRSVVRAGATPRHVPAVIAQVHDIPRTRSGKITELAVRSTVHGEPVRNTEALANPEALAEYADHPELAD